MFTKSGQLIIDIYTKTTLFKQWNNSHHVIDERLIHIHDYDANHHFQVRPQTSLIDSKEKPAAAAKQNLLCPFNFATRYPIS